MVFSFRAFRREWQPQAIRRYARREHAFFETKQELLGGTVTRLFLVLFVSMGSVLALGQTESAAQPGNRSDNGSAPAMLGTYWDKGVLQIGRAHV